MSGQQTGGAYDGYYAGGAGQAQGVAQDGGQWAQQGQAQYGTHSRALRATAPERAENDDSMLARAGAEAGYDASAGAGEYYDAGAAAAGGYGQGQAAEGQPAAYDPQYQNGVGAPTEATMAQQPGAAYTAQPGVSAPYGQQQPQAYGGYYDSEGKQQQQPPATAAAQPTAGGYAGGGVAPGSTGMAPAFTAPTSSGRMGGMQANNPPPADPTPEWVHPCDPRQMCLTTSILPNQRSTAQRSNVPLGVLLQPMAESAVQVPLVNYGAVGVVRCKFCRAYMNPYVKWTDGGANWICNLCDRRNETPSGYYSSVDTNGYRADLAKRPELLHCTCEVVATPHYMVRAPMPCCYVFVLDVSKWAVSSGMLTRACATIKASLDTLPGGARTLVGLLGYDSKVHYYSLDSKCPTPRVLVGSDLDDIFLPVPRGLLVNLKESRSQINTLLDTLPTMYAGSTDVECAVGPALLAAYQIMAQMGGKLTLMAAGLPSIGKGRLASRDNPQKLGKSDEHKQLMPQTKFYKDLAFKFSHEQISVDVFLFSVHYTDVATLNDLAKFTGGQTHRFGAYFDPRDGQAFASALSHALSREQGWESVVRVRVGSGYKVTDFYGNFRLRSTDLLTVPCIDSDKSFALKLDVADEKKPVGSATLSIQSALLYTTSSGERRIRVHTICVPVTSYTAHIYTAISAPAVTTMLTKTALARVGTAGFQKTREFVKNQITQLIRSYSYTSGGFGAQQQGLPANIAPLALQCLGILKHKAFRNRSVSSDERAAIHALLYSAGVNEIDLETRPRLIPIHNLTVRFSQPLF